MLRTTYMRAEAERASIEHEREAGHERASGSRGHVAHVASDGDTNSPIRIEAAPPYTSSLRR